MTSSMPFGPSLSGFVTPARSKPEWPPLGPETEDNVIWGAARPAVTRSPRGVGEETRAAGRGTRGVRGETLGDEAQD